MISFTVKGIKDRYKVFLHRPTLSHCIIRQLVQALRLEEVLESSMAFFHKEKL